MANLHSKYPIKNEQFHNEGFIELFEEFDLEFNAENSRFKLGSHNIFSNVTIGHIYIRMFGGGEEKYLPYEISLIKPVITLSVNNGYIYIAIDWKEGLNSTHHHILTKRINHIHQKQFTMFDEETQAKLMIELNT